MRRVVALALALVALAAVHSPGVRAADGGHYTLVNNWVHFPPEVTGWGMATGVDVDAHDNVYVLHRNDAMPIMVFDRHGNFVRAWGKGLFKTIGEGPNTRVVKTAKDGSFIKWWGGKGAAPGQFDTPHSIAIDSKGLVYVADRANNRIEIFDQDGKFLDQWTHFGTPWGVSARDDKIYVVDGTDANCLYIANLKDGKVVETIEGLSNPTAVAVDSTGAIYVGEVNGTNVKKFVKEAKK